MVAFSEPVPMDRYEQYDEPCQDEYDPYLECKYNMKSYFPSCWALSRASRSPSDDLKAVSCFLERLTGLREADPLRYLPLKGDPKDPKGISEYKKTRTYARRLRGLKKDLEYLPSAPFCLYSNSPLSYKEGEIDFGLRGLRFVNLPKGKIKASRAQGNVFNQIRKGRVPVAYFYVKEGGAFLLEYLTFCKGSSCPYFLSITEEGSVL
jgi:hypothetical protein